MNPKGVKAAIKAFLEATRGNVAPEAIIHHRASICKRCPERKVTRGISKVSEKLGILSGKHGVPNEIAAFTCGVCKCSLLLLLPATKENIHEDSPEEAKKRPETCWIKKL